MDLECSICSGPLRADSASGICYRNPSCRKEARRAQYRSAYKRRMGAWRAENPETAPLTAEQYQASRRRSLCRIAKCGRPHSANGLCGPHRNREKAGLPVDVEIPRRDKPKSVCRVEKCLRYVEAKDLCSGHYGRWQRGIRGAELELPIRNIQRKGSGTLDINGYRKVTRRGERVPEHRVIMEGIIGRELYKFENVHHKNGIRDDNRPENLEPWTKSQPSGQRPEDLAAWVLDTYPEIVRRLLAERRV